MTSLHSIGETSPDKITRTESVCFSDDIFFAVNLWGHQLDADPLMVPNSFELTMFLVFPLLILMTVSFTNTLTGVCLNEATCSFFRKAFWHQVFPRLVSFPKAGKLVLLFSY